MGNSGTPLKLSTAPWAVPTSSLVSKLRVLARKIQSGNQSGPGKRRQVVKVALWMTVRSSSTKSTRSA